MADLIELEIPARPDYLALARLIVAAAAAGEPLFTLERIADLRVAVSEACTNAIEAQRRGSDNGGGPSNILIRCELESDRVLVEVVDHGAGFDVDDLEHHPPVTDPARLDHERGLGIPLIRILTDEAEFHPSAGGTAVRMVLLATPRSEDDTAEFRR